MNLPVDGGPAAALDGGRPGEFDDERDAVFFWSYGQRLWNVGCGSS